jgi:TolA-binding protein
METKVMKITWAVAVLASSVTAVHAQQTPRPAAPPAAPAPVTAPTPKPAPRARRVEPVIMPDFDLLLDAPSAMTMIAPGQGITPFPPMPAIAPLALEFELLPTRPVQLELPIALEFPPTPPRPGQAPVAIEALMELPPLPAIPPTPAEPMIWGFPQGQGPTTPAPARRPVRDAELEQLLRALDREEAARRREIDQSIRQAEMQDRQAQRQLEQQLSQAQRAAEMADRQAQRQIEQQVAQAQRQFEMQDRQLQRELEQSTRSAQMSHTVEMTRSINGMLLDRSSSHVTVPAPWAQDDIADSAYRNARELFNRGEWGQAAQAFRALPTKYPNSAYAPEAAYYQAFSLFRIGGTTELREALAVLEASRAKYPNSRSRTEATNLTTRIQGVLAARGDKEAAAALSRTANDQPVTCDREEQAVQAEAMNALSRSDQGNLNELITRVLARKDECAIPLRRTAVFLVGNRRDAQAITILAGVARNDPSVDVKVEAIQVIGRLPNEEGVPVLEELAKNDDERIQRAAVRALVRHPSARARGSVRTLVESDNVSERVRSEALSAFDSDRATADDVAWLRALYGKVTSRELKVRTLSAIVRIGGPEVDQWLVTIARDETQPSEIRSTAMRKIGETMSIADLGKLYDGATQQRFRAEIINVLGKRKEDAATEKLIDIVKNGTDPSLRRSAIQAVMNKNDPKATQLLLDIINK